MTKVRISLLTLLCLVVFAPASIAQEMAARWWQPYEGADATGPNVLGFWKFDGDESGFVKDSSTYQHKANIRGARQNSDGRFGRCLESDAGYPVADESHGLHIARHPALSPTGPFTVEMWIQAKDSDRFAASYSPVLLDMKYIPGNHTGFMFTLTAATSTGNRQLSLEIGTGDASVRWYSLPLQIATEAWQHVAFTYDGRGTVEFFVNGCATGRTTKELAGPMAAAVRPLSIGDRIGSLYRGFPGLIDEVRITKGVREFRPIRFRTHSERFVFVRMSKDAFVSGDISNRTGELLSGAEVVARLPDGSTQQINIPDLEKDGSCSARINVDTALKPGAYFVELSVTVPRWGGDEDGFKSRSRIPVLIVKRPLPDRMPVIMWGLGGTDGVVKEIPRLKQIGFTHCLGLRCNFQQIWDDGIDAMPGSTEDVRGGREMLDVALENDIGIVASLSPGRWLRTAAIGKPFLRIDREGKHYDREDISGVFPEVQDFVFNSGVAMGRAYGDHPAFHSALLHTEVRGESQVSFHPIEVDAYRKATGAEIPDAVTIKNGVRWQNLPEIPKNRVIADDDPVLRYLQWFWQEGDGWNGLHSRLHEGLKQHTHDRFWTFHDPAARVPSISGSGGKADVLAHWTYSYPDPVRIGLCTDELFEMARANGQGQDVMKMTQLIWYRSQTAPKNDRNDADSSPWVDKDPDANYISIAPMHLREALWWKLSRPIKGIMYHGWQSLVKTDSPGAYRYTNSNTQHELQRLIEEVVQPLGPTLMQIPDAPSDVAFLESFTSQMFARRGTYGWNHGWAGDVYHVLMYAQLQPRVLYEESLLNGGLDGAKVLVMPDCDVLTESVVRTIKEFQKSGGLVVADRECCPAITADFVIPRFARTKQADKDNAILHNAAKSLRAWIDAKYNRTVDSSNPKIVTRRRQYGTTDYVFAINDHREYGTYVGGYGLVMEDGLPSETTILVDRAERYVYDLVDGRRLVAKEVNGALEIPLQLGPCEGRVLMITKEAIKEIRINTTNAVSVSDSIEIEIDITDGVKPIDAVIPVEVDIVDPEGRRAEFSGNYGAAGGRLEIHFDFAANDRPGVWQIRARERASGKSASTYVRVKPTETPEISASIDEK